MKSDNYYLLSDILKELRKEENDINAEIEYNLACGELPEKLIQRKYILLKKISSIEKILQSENNGINLLKIQEEERQRIAADLHDTTLQNLACLVHKIELSSMYMDKDPVQAKLELSVMKKHLKDTIEEMRQIIFDLRPMTFDDLGLCAALERLVYNINEKGQYKIVSEIDNVSCENNLVLLSIYRIVQEALTNIRKHAEANKIIFSCKEIESQCILDIEDNGKGLIDMPDGKMHFGISMMKERVEMLGGKFVISSARNDGTKIHIEVPLK